MPSHDPLDALKQDPQAAALLSDPKALAALLGSKEAKTMANLLQKVGKAQLQAAAQAAVSGDGTALGQILDKVTQNADGKSAMEALERREKR